MSATNRTTEKMDARGLDKDGPCVEPKSWVWPQRNVPINKDTGNAKTDGKGKLTRK